MLFFLMTWNLTKVRPFGPTSTLGDWGVNHRYMITPTRTMYQVIHGHMLYTCKIAFTGGFFSWFDLICGQVEANMKCFCGVWAKRTSLLNVFMYHFILVLFFFSSLIIINFAVLWMCVPLWLSVSIFCNNWSSSEVVLIVTFYLCFPHSLLSSFSIYLFSSMLDCGEEEEEKKKIEIIFLCSVHLVPN